jgi:hypothetical protein
MHWSYSANDFRSALDSPFFHSFKLKARHNGFQSSREVIIQFKFISARCSIYSISLFAKLFAQFPPGKSKIPILSNRILPLNSSRNLRREGRNSWFAQDPNKKRASISLDTAITTLNQHGDDRRRSSSRQTQVDAEWCGQNWSITIPSKKERECAKNFE